MNDKYDIRFNYRLRNDDIIVLSRTSNDDLIFLVKCDDGILLNDVKNSISKLWKQSNFKFNLYLEGIKIINDYQSILRNEKINNLFKI